MKRLLLFSALFLTACTTKQVVVKKVYIRSKCPYLEYNASIPKDITFKAKQKDGKIVISKDDFKKILDNYVILKNELNETNTIIKIYNKNLKRINHD